MAMSVSSETTFFSMNLQSAICPQLRTDDFQIIPFKDFNTYNSCYTLPEIHLTFPQESV